MDVDDTPAEAAVRAEARAWLRSVAKPRGEGDGAWRPFRAKTDDRRRRPARDGQGVAAHEVRRRLGRRRTGRSSTAARAARHRGGRGRPRRSARFDVPANFFMVGIDMAGPTLMAHGTPEQQKRFLEPMLRGDESWCQLFSEPGAGCDLASLEHARRARRRRVGGHGPEGVDVVGPHRRLGHAAWPAPTPTSPSTPASPTSSSTCTRPASTCDRCARSTAPSTSTRCSSTTCGCPHDHVVGDVGDGWRVAMTTLTAERTAIGGGGLTGWREVARPGPPRSARRPTRTCARSSPGSPPAR